MALKEAAKLKDLLFIPSEIQSHIHEGFDPILVSGDVIDQHFQLILDLVLDFDTTNPVNNDAKFIEELKDAFAYFIGEWIEEL